ncbi:hypothetical protein GQ55_1G280300 [Panicum hallii var. hallii]|uniref:NET domain-containing protein n=1 Tax=Panicum hallii var. hallii TaxID=1504633 RepID=A0A2T7F899_9POAL|nr:hypothetical protein GQ55_1G280300 [Panicum hallii var. hallii]
MAQELAVRGVRVEEYSAPARKGVLVRRGAFAVRREVFAVGKMSVPARRLLRKRLVSELDAVRDALRKAELLSCGAAATGAAAPAGTDGWLMAAKAPVGEDGGRAAKRRKVAPFAEQGAGKPKRMRQDDSRERLAGRLASLAAALPDHVVAFLLNQRVGDADSRGDGGEIKKDVQPMKGGALSQLKMLLNKFAPESTPRNRGAPMVVSGGSCLSRHQGAGGKTATVQEEEEEEVVAVDICGGVSRIAIRDIAEEYGELVEDIGVKLLSPLQRKYVDLAEQGEYVDICGDASPVVFPTKAGDSSSSPSLTSSDSDASSSDSDSSSSSDSDSKSDPDKSVNSRSPPPAIVPKEKDTYAQPPVPAPEAVHTAEPEVVQDQCAPPAPTVLQIISSLPAPAVLLPKVNDTYAQPPEPAPETVQIVQQEMLQDQCAPPAPTGHPATSSPPGPAAVPKENDTYKQPPEPAPEAVQIAEPVELQDQSLAPVATGHPITGSAPPSAVLPEENGISSQPPELAPVAAQIAEPEEVQGEGAAPAPINDLSDLVTMAKEEAERRRQLAKERAKAKARRMLLEMEKAARPDERVHPRDMELLGIAAFEHVASTVQDARTAPPRVNDGGDLRVSPGGPSVLQQLGIFLKADDGSEDDEEEEQQQPAVAAFASHGEDMEVEDGEIR